MPGMIRGGRVGSAFLRSATSRGHRLSWSGVVTGVAERQGIAFRSQAHHRPTFECSAALQARPKSSLPVYADKKDEAKPKHVLDWMTNKERCVVSH